MFRRTWIVLLVIIIAVFALAACGGKAEPTPVPTEAPTIPTDTPIPPATPEEPTPTPVPTAEQPETITRADADLVIWADNTRAPVMRDVATKFQDEYGVTVAVQEVGFGDIRDQVKLA
ncbi:MAG: hypothetical protein GXP38_09100, partial [Chloroflexi bacterium]|nr:hypothetical protein [Chloroflexota bacterium]